MHHYDIACASKILLQIKKDSIAKIQRKNIVNFQSI